MPSPTGKTTPPPGTPYATIEQKIPAWLKSASPDTLRAMRDGEQAPTWLATAILQMPDIGNAWRDEHARHRDHAAQVRRLFEALPELQSYASQQLSEAISERFGLTVDVQNCYLVDARLIDIANAIDSRQAIDRATRSLLHCALHNFDAAAAVKHGMDAEGGPLKKSVIVDHRRFMGTVPITNTLNIEAEAFAELCRDLDLGRKYHDKVHAIYYPHATAQLSADEAALNVYRTLGRAEVSAFRQSLHFARLKGDISEVLYTTALATPLDRLPAESAGPAIAFSLLTLWEAELTGVALITLRTSAQDTVALYIPDDNETPLKEFASLEALKADLSGRLRANIAYLDRHIADRDKGPVIARLKDRLAPIGWSVRGLHERVPDPHATLYPVAQPFRHAFEGVMAFQKAERHEKDVLFHAIPTAIVDRRTALAHRQLIAGRVLTGLNIAGFFVPGLGEAMLAVCLTQLACEVYEGIDAWKNDERDAAYGYLVDVVENVALMAALSAAAKALKNPGEGAAGGPGEEPEVERIPVETPSFIEALETVELPNGEARLWKPDLTPYRSPQVLPANLEPDEHGLLHYQGKRWLVVQGNQYIVRPTAATDQYRLVHPARPVAHEPALRHNGAGAWLLPLEHPLQWPMTTLVQRMGLASEQFSEETALQILRVCDVHENVLRHVLTENQRLPALLEDTLTRFRLDQAVRQLPDRSRWPTELERAYARLPASQASGAAVIQRVYPNVPAAITDEVLRNATSGELAALGSGKLPLRLAEEIRVFQQQVRLARAYEGLFLASVRNGDTDRLIMHSLERLPGWPADINLELRQHRFWPAHRERVGPTDARSFTVITSAEAGYIVHAEAGAQTPVAVYGDLCTALYAALPQAMAQVGIVDGADLRLRLQEGPLLSRTSLRQVLGMQPVRPGYRSPMRLANGRIGYPLSGGLPTAPIVSRQALLEAVNATGLAEHTPRSADQILMIIAGGGRNPQQVLGRLQQLVDQRIEMQSRLDDWNEGISTASDQAAQQYSALRQAIMQHWYDTALVEGDSHTSELSLEQVPLADIPMTLPAFFTSNIRRLRLYDLPSGTLAGWAQNERLLQRLLRQVPQLESLEISRAYDPSITPSSFIFSIPTITEHLPGLRALRFINQNVALTSNDMNQLAQLPLLRYLDLSGNRFAQRDSPSFHEFSLDYLGLNAMQLHQWPIGLGSDALERIAHVSLRDNNLRSLPSFLLNEAEAIQRPSSLSLEGNEINETHLQRLLLSENRMNVQVNVDHSPELTQRLERIQNERQQLREAIEGWAQASSSNAPLTQAVLEDRQRIEVAITEFWSRQEQGLQYLRLQLENVALEHFPRRLPAFFGERVTALTLTRVSGSTAQLNELLGRFPNITRLTVEAHVAPMPSLPSALVRLQRLAHLEFRNMGLEIDQAMIEAFARLPQLSSLDLSGNQIGAITQIPANLSANLTSLSLTNMNLQAWPAWCDALLPLELLDLSSNHISELPNHILENIHNPMPISSISMFDNPLSEDTIQRVRTFSDSQHSLSFALDIPDNLILIESSDEGSLLDHPHFPVPFAGDDSPRLEDWALGNQAQNEALSDCWQRLQTLENGQNLLALAGRLRNAAPYLDPTSQAAFCERVRIMLVIAATHEHELPTMSSIAAAALPDPVTGSQTCHDGALQEFNNIELYLMSNRILTDAGDSLPALYRRLLQLYRIGQLELLANSRTGQGDRVSVRLAYRRELARELDLPIADSMRFRGAAMLAPGEISSVLERVRQKENSDAFIQYMLANDDWTRRLRAEYPGRFAEIEQRYGEQVLELAALDLPLTEELALQQNLQDAKEHQELELLQELTRMQGRPE
ncbi:MULTISPECIES: dermonecrotic toxin domain-containing protein [Pseudomonas]|uniref:dermonecrotic toxin domain-containing protein n=1 Tax=Pseudomonas TaxID=286 RepID=UPI00226FA7B1|nr:DUF6543 domain-containing protein [Pseudomonas putida]WAB98518.1 NEL-type E3 ubiquitin ligase domain-containing protein [Pseudomonas putida]